MNWMTQREGIWETSQAPWMSAETGQAWITELRPAFLAA
jgi:hypothetical protein